MDDGAPQLLLSPFPREEVVARARTARAAAATAAAEGVAALGEDEV